MIRTIKSSDKELDAYIKSRNHLGDRESTGKAAAILEDVRNNKDKALFKYCSIFDNTELDINSIKVCKQEIEDAYALADKDFIEIIKKAKKNIEEFHREQLQKSWIMTKNGGALLGQLIRPISKVGIYVPGGTAAYPSSVLMNAVPAKIAGVDKIYMATPCRNGKINPYTIVAACECGVDEIFKIGGVQAIGALAFGTESVPKVDKIVGPGNAYVAAAKREVYGYVDIDMIAGPSEILIIADENANSRYIAADMMSQAEHDVLASSILVTLSEDLVKKVEAEIEIQSKNLSRRNIIFESLSSKGMAVLVKSLDEAIEIANMIAPEHLEVLVKNPMELLDGIKNAGSIFLGEYSPEPLGDYFAGPNHVLPTGGTSAFFSPLSVDSFIKKSSFIYYNQESLIRDGKDIMKFASYEGLDAHKNSIAVRMKQ